MGATVTELAERLIGAFNARDIGAVLAVIHETVEFDFGAKTLRGDQEVREFVERQLYGAAYRVTHGRRFQRGDDLVAESRQELGFVETGDPASVEHLAALYVARDGRLARYAEFADLDSAFAVSSVSVHDEISGP